MQRDAGQVSLLLFAILSLAAVVMLQLLGCAILNVLTVIHDTFEAIPTPIVEPAAG